MSIKHGNQMYQVRKVEWKLCQGIMKNMEKIDKSSMEIKTIYIKRQITDFT